MRSFSFLENIQLGIRYLFEYPSVRSFTYKSPEDIKQYQFKKIQKLIKSAYNNSIFYHELYKKHGIDPDNIKTWDDFEKLPTVSKDEIIAAGNDVMLGSRKKDSNIRLSQSSGSSGKIIKIYRNSPPIQHIALIVLRMYKQSIDYKRSDKQALIYTSEYPFRSILGMYKSSYIYTLTEPSKMLKKLQHLQPALIAVYPTIILELIAKFEKECRSLHPKAIVTNSEHSTQDQRDYISKVFGCPVFDKYSTEELALISYQCKYKKYHLIEDASYIEILKTNEDEILENGNIGEVVGTCLVSPVMPFIRYRQGDLGAIESNSCECGNNSRVMNGIVGRKNSSFKLSNGDIIPSGKVLDWTYKFFLEFHMDILEFQIIQQSIDHIDVIIVTGLKYKVDDNKKIEDSFKQQFGEGVHISVKKVSHIPRTPAGKHIPIRSFVV